jgi:predicted phosphoribosyltransferase
MTQELLMPTAPAQDLASALAGMQLPRPLVVAMPAGMTTACRIAQVLGAPFDVLVGSNEHPAPAGRHQAVPDHGLPQLKGRSVVLADDGDAGIAAWAEALKALRSMQPDLLVVATPRLQPVVARWFAATFGSETETEAAAEPAAETLCQG